MRRKHLYLIVMVFSTVLFLVSCGSAKVYAPVSHQYSSIKPNSTAHIVRRGDTLYSIAWQLRRDYREIARWNNIRPPYTIYTGQELTLIAPYHAAKKRNRTVIKSTKTVKKQQLTKKSSSNNKKTLKLSWAWPINVRQVEKDRANSGVILIGSPGELVRSSESGNVVYAGNGLKGYGNLLIIMHNEEFLTAYGYNKRLLVDEGSVVKKGQAIAEIGKDSKQRPILFFELRRHGKAVTISQYLPKYGR
jgi:lipoprotein NlpD